MRTPYEIVNHLAQYFVDNNRPGVNREPLPTQVEELVDQLGDFLGNRLKNNPPFREVWDGFVNDPEVYATFLVVALESIFNTDRTVHQRVDHLLEKITIAGVRTAGEALNILDVNTEAGMEGFGWVADVEAHPIVLVGNEGEQFPEAENRTEPDRRGISGELSSALMVRKSAEIVYMPSMETKLPFMFMSLGQLMDSSDEWSLENKLMIEKHLDLIRAQLTGNSAFDEKLMMNAIDAIKEIDSSFSDTLINALQSHIDDLPLEAREFLVEYRKLR